MFCVITPLFGRISVAVYTINLFGKAKGYLKPWLWGLIFTQVVSNIGIVITLLAVCGFDMMEVSKYASTPFDSHNRTDADKYRLVLKPRATGHHLGHASQNSLVVCYLNINARMAFNNCSHFLAFNAFTDGALVLTPVFLIAGLHTTRRAKWLASALLGFSSIACGAAVWRTIELDDIFAADWDFTRKHQLPHQPHQLSRNKNTNKPPDSAVPYFYASSFEQSTILIAAAIPTLGPALKFIRTKSSSTFASHNGSNNHSRHGNEVSRHSSSDSIKLQKDLAHMLGVQMPGLGNTVTISAGKDKQRLFSKSSRESMPMPMANIKTVRSTDIKVEAVPAYSIKEGEEDVEKLFSMPKVVSRDGAK